MARILYADASREDLLARIAELEAKKTPKLSVRVNPVGEVRQGQDGKSYICKGTISVLGLQKFPLSLYKSQWERLFSIIDEVRAHYDDAGVADSK